MTEQIQINRQTIYLTIENVRIETKNGIEEQKNQFVGFFKYNPPTSIIFGEQIKNADGENVIFNSSELAKNTIINQLEKTVYPPSFLKPMSYTKKNLPEIMYKELIFDIGNFSTDEINETIVGKITNCTMASNSSISPVSVRIMTNKGERRLSISEIKNIRR